MSDTYAWTTPRFSIAPEKAKAVAFALKTTPLKVIAWCTGRVWGEGLDEQVEHQRWLDTARPAEIFAWISHYPDWWHYHKSTP